MQKICRAEAPSCGLGHRPAFHCRASYSSFFQVLGYSEIITTAEQEMFFIKNRVRKERDFFIVEPTDNSPLNLLFNRKEGSRWEKVRFMIREDVLAFLEGKKYYKEVNWPTHEERVARSRDGFQLYGDGTAIDMR